MTNESAAPDSNASIALESGGQRLPRYTLIIPAHNEAARIGSALPAYLNTFGDSEILVVLNGCTDSTSRVVAELASGHANLRILQIDYAVGKGGAVRAGFLAARAPLIGYVDADGSTPADEIRRLFSLLENDVVDAVIGSRWSPLSEVVVRQPLLRRLSSRVFNSVVRATFRLPFHDTQCGAKVFRAHAIHAISSALEVSNFAFDIDLLHSLMNAGYRIQEVPTRWYDTHGSKIDLPRASREMLVAVARLRLRHSLFRSVIPLFDRVWPTAPISVRDGLAVLIIGEWSVDHPSAGPIEKYIYEVSRRLVKQGHKIYWATGGQSGRLQEYERDGIHYVRIGNAITLHAAMPMHYLRYFRDRFDVIVDVQHTLPMLPAAFSLKPQLRIVSSCSPRPTMIHAVAMYFATKLQPNLPTIALTARAKEELVCRGVPERNIDVVPAPAEGESWRDTTSSFLAALYRAFSRDRITYVRTGTEWSIVTKAERKKSKHNVAAVARDGALARFS